MIKTFKYEYDAWNLCSGKLTVEFEDGEVLEFNTPQGHERFWSTGGYCCWQEYYVDHGPWYFDSFEETKLPAGYEEKYMAICERFQEEVPYGCCGGCL